MNNYSNYDINNDIIRNSFSINFKKDNKFQNNLNQNNNFKLNNNLKDRTSFNKNFNLNKNVNFKKDNKFQNNLNQNNHLNQNKIENSQLINSESIVSNNQSDLIKTLTDEIFEKDKKIQELKNENQIFEKKIQTLNNKNNEKENNINELISLKKELNEKNKLIENLNDKINDYEKLDDIINKNKIIILKQKCNIINLTKELNGFYKNEKLEKILLSKDFTKQKIKEKFIEYKIKNDTNITKDLIEKIIKH